MVSTKRATYFKWKVQGHAFQYSPMLLKIEGCDMILGQDWLKFCIPIELDYSNMRFTVTLHGERVKLQAVTNTMDCKLIIGQVLCSLMHTEISEIQEIFVQGKAAKGEKVPTDLESLLSEYSDIFEELVGLPPSRGIEHQIKFKSGCILKHQYHYITSHGNKDEIEKIVA